MSKMNRSLSLSPSHCSACPADARDRSSGPFHLGNEVTREPDGDERAACDLHHHGDERRGRGLEPVYSLRPHGTGVRPEPVSAQPGEPPQATSAPMPGKQRATGM